MTLWAARFRYPAGAGGTVVALSQPLPRWTDGRTAVGGSLRLDTGARESWVDRVDRTRTLPLVLTEVEWQQLAALVEWAHANWGQPFEVDLGNGTWVAAQLDAPEPGKALTYSRTPYPGDVQTSLTLSRADRAAWTEVFD